MGTATMARKKRDEPAAPKDDRAGRKTAPVQVEKELARMVGVIAAHRGVSQAVLVSPLIRQWVLTQYELVSREIAAEMRDLRERPGG